jgi:DNA-binding response OmpR family regulator
MLRQAGARRVQPTDNPDAAIWIMGQMRNAILLTDWRKDFSCGPGLIRRLRRADGALRLAPALLLSDQRSLTQIEDARDAGASAIAVRPVATQAFIDRLTEITQRPRAFITTSRFTGPDRRPLRTAETTGAFKRQVDVDAGLTTEIDAARAQARAMIDEKLRRHDPLAARVGRSLERYLRHAGAMTTRTREIVELHRGSLGRLDDHHGAAMAVRLDIVEGLERLVERRAAA